MAGGTHSELVVADADVGHTRTDCNGGLPVGGLHRLECTSTGCDGDG